MGSLFRVRITVQGHRGILMASSQQLAPPPWEMEEAMSLESSEAAALREEGWGICCGEKQLLPEMAEQGGKPGPSLPRF